VRGERAQDRFPMSLRILVVIHRGQPSARASADRPRTSAPPNSAVGRHRPLPSFFCEASRLRESSVRERLRFAITSGQDSRSPAMTKAGAAEADRKKVSASSGREETVTDGGGRSTGFTRDSSADGKAGVLGPENRTSSLAGSVSLRTHARPYVQDPSFRRSLP
jgi:hypothetical protein